MATDKKVLQGKYEYSLKSKLGSGSFADVYKGVHLETGEELAIKVVNKEGIKKYGEEIMKALGSEVTILQNISYSIETPFIVKIFDCFQTANNIYMILEFCNNGTLYDIMKKKKKIPEKDAIYILYHIINALELLAQNNIAHRDLKPENIFVKDNLFKLGDFGFASQKNLFNTTLGTYPYMAPEIFKHETYTTSIDIWALGAMYHEMLFGELYFIGKNHQEVANNVKNKAYTVKNQSEISKDSVDLLMKCMEKDPNKRITAKEFKNHPLFDNIRKKPIFSPPLSLIRQGNSIDKKSPTVSPKVSPRVLNQNSVSPLNNMKMQVEKSNSINQVGDLPKETQPNMPNLIPSYVPQGLAGPFNNPNPQGTAAYAIPSQGGFIFPQGNAQNPISHISGQVNNIGYYNNIQQGGNYDLNFYMGQGMNNQFDPSKGIPGQYAPTQGAIGQFAPIQGYNGQFISPVNGQFPIPYGQFPGPYGPNPVNFVNQQVLNNDTSIIRDQTKQPSTYQSLVDESQPRSKENTIKEKNSFIKDETRPTGFDLTGNLQAPTVGSKFNPINTLPNPNNGFQAPSGNLSNDKGGNIQNKPTPTGDETPGGPTEAVLKPSKDDRVVFDAGEQDGILLYKLMNFRNLVVFLKETAEGLGPFVEECRFCPFYLLSHGLSLMRTFLSKLNDRSLSVVQLGINTSEEIWKKFLDSPLLPRFTSKLTEDLHQMQQILDHYLEQLEGFLNENFDSKTVQTVKSVVRNEPSFDNKRLFIEEINEKMKHFFSKATKLESNSAQKRAILIIAYELFLCLEVETLNFNNFSLDSYKEKKDSLNAKDLELLIEKRSYRIFMT